MNRDDFKKNAEKNIDNIFDSIEKLEKQKNNMSAAAKVEYDIQLNELKQQQQKMQAALKNLKSASDDKWDDAKRSYNDATDVYKSEYLEFTSRKKDDINKSIESLKAKANDVHSESKAQYEDQLKKLNEHKVHIENKYNELKNASDDKWHEVSEAFNSASDSFGEGFSKIGSLFHKK